MTSSEPTDPGGWTDETNTGDLAFQLHATPGFIGHEVAVYGKYYDANNSQQRFGPPFLLGVERVGDGVEFEPFDGPNVGSGGFDFDAFTIDIDESNLAERNFVNAAGNFNGYTIEDTNGTLPDFVSATIDETVSTRTTPKLLVTPNTIWVNDESHTYEPNAFLRINVRFADRVSDPAPAIVPVLDGLFLLEAPAEVGRRHRFERSTDLTTWTPFDVLYVADSPFATTLVGPAGATSHFRLRRSN